MLVCPCGYKFARRVTAQPEHVDGALSEITKAARYSLLEYTRYADDNDEGVSALITKAHQRGWKPGAVHHMKEALYDARRKYRDAFNAEPKQHWNVATLGNMVEVAGKRRSV